MNEKEREDLLEYERVLQELKNRKRERGMDFYTPNPIQFRAHQSKAKTIAFSAGNRAGKCLPLDTPILMASGRWIKLKDIQVGDRVVSENGFGVVLNKINSGVKKCYKITFEDGGYLVASGEHHFPISLGSGRCFKHRLLSDLISRKGVSNSKKARFLSYKDIGFEDKNIPINPYLLGVLIGDGTLGGKSCLGFTNIDTGIINRTDELLREIGYCLKKYGKCDYRIISLEKIKRNHNGTFGKSFLREEIKKLGLDCNSRFKFVPDIYKLNTVEVRKQVLAGLIDTDGSFQDFCVSSKQLANDFVFLVKSLGGKATLNETSKKCNNKFFKAYRVYWRLESELPLIRKDKQGIKTKRAINYTHRIVKLIEEVGDLECGDIEISHPSHYFVSWDWIVTGNTTFGAMEIAWHVTKKYPDWFPKERRFQGPVKIRITTDKFFKIDTVIEPKLRAYLPAGEIISLKRSPQGYITKLQTKDGSFIEFLTMEQDQMAFEGQDLDILWGDEPSNRSRYIASQRGLLDRGGLTILTFTPITEPWMKEEIVDKSNGKQIEVFTADVRDNKFDIRGNTILEEKNIQDWENLLTDEEKETRIHGKFFHLRGIVYKEFSDVHLIGDFKYETNYPVICVLDPHDRLPHWVIWAMIDRINDIYVMHEKITQCTISELAATIRAIEKYFGWNVVKRLIDPNFGRKNMVSVGISVMDELSKYRCPFSEANDDKEAGRLKVKEYLHYNSKRPLDINNRPKLYFVRDRVPKTIHSVRNYQYDEWKGDQDRDPKEKEKPKDEHGADATRYLCISQPSFRMPEIYQPVMTEVPY